MICDYHKLIVQHSIYIYVFRDVRFHKFTSPHENNSLSVKPSNSFLHATFLGNEQQIFVYNIYNICGKMDEHFRGYLV